MKTLLTFFVLSLFIFSCSSNNDDTTKEENSILGNWQLTAVFGSSGSSSNWTPIEDGYVYNFTNDGIIISDRFDCNGTYIIDNNNINIKFQCSDSSFNLSYDISYEENDLILTPNPSPCDEGCAERYTKINN